MVLHDIEGGRVDNFLLEVQMGHVPGAEIRWIYALNPNVTTTISDIWELGGTYNYLTAPQQLWVWSTNALDTVPVFLSGIDANYNRQTETIILNGTTPVQTTKSWLRMCYMENGDGVDILGNVYASRVSGSTVVSNVVNYIDPKYQHSTQSCLTIPAGKTGFVFQGEASTGKLKDVSILFKIREYQKSFITHDIIDLYQNTVTLQRPFMPVLEKSDMKVSAISSSAGTQVSIQYGVILLDNAHFNLN